MPAGSSIFIKCRRGGRCAIDVLAREVNETSDIAAPDEQQCECPVAAAAVTQQV